MKSVTGVLEGEPNVVYRKLFAVWSARVRSVGFHPAHLLPVESGSYERTETLSGTQRQSIVNRIVAAMNRRSKNQEERVLSRGVPSLSRDEVESARECSMRRMPLDTFGPADDDASIHVHHLS